MADSNALLSTSLSGLIPSEISNEIIQTVLKGSFCLQNSRREPMTTVEKVIPVLMSLPGPTWTGEGKKINVIKPSIVPVTLTAKKLGFILTASREVLNDTVLKTFEQLAPSIAESFALAIDKAIIAGDTIEGSSVFSNTVLNVAELQKVERSKNNIADDIADALEKIEVNGYDATNILAINSIKNELRKTKTSTGEYLYKDVNDLYGTQVNYTNHFDETKGFAVVGNFKNYLVTGIYQDIQYDVLREASLTLDNSTVINLAQQDLIGIRVTMRVAANFLRKDCFSLVAPKTT